MTAPRVLPSRTDRRGRVTTSAPPQRDGGGPAGTDATGPGARPGGPVRDRSRPAIVAAASAIRTKARAALWRRVLWDNAFGSASNDSALNDSASSYGAPDDGASKDSAADSRVLDDRATRDSAPEEGAFDKPAFTGTDFSTANGSHTDQGREP